MNRLEKAAAFGAMMGKRAAEVVPPTASTNARESTTKAPREDLKFYGGPHNRVGTLPSASTTVSIPNLTKFTDSKIYPKTVSRASILKQEEPGFPNSNYLKPYNQFIANNYSNNSGGLGSSRLGFHRDLSHQLYRARDEGAGDTWGKWNKRIGELADNTRDQAPIRHLEYTDIGSANRLANSVGDPLFKTLEPHSSSTPLPRRDNKAPTDESPVTYAPSDFKGNPGWDYPKAAINPNTVRLHEASHTGYQTRGAFATTDSRGLPIKKVSENDNDAAMTMARRQVGAEAGATFNEVGQGARAFKDVTGKHMEGDYEFAPGVSMANRELGELAKKYKPSDLNSPAGQLFMRRILEKSTGPVGYTHEPGFD